MEKQFKGFGLKPLSTNRGAILPGTKEGRFGLIDWISGTYSSQKRERFQILAERFFKGPFIQRSFGASWYRESWANDAGVILAFDHMGGSSHRSYFEMKGAVCAQYPDKLIIRFLRRVHKECAFRASRVDLAIDDYNHSFHPERMDEAWKARNVFGIRSFFDYHSSSDRPGKDGLATATIGKRGDNNRQLCCYQKRDKNGYRLRVELRQWGELAAKCVAEICCMQLHDMGLFGSFILSCIAGAVDFRDSEGGRVRRSRARRLDWWAAFVDDSSPIKFVRRFVESTFERSKQFLERLAPTIYMVFQLLSERGDDYWDFLGHLLESGLDRQSARHVKIFREERFNIARNARLLEIPGELLKEPIQKTLGFVS